MASLGALADLGVTVAAWALVGRQQPMWPLPALYFIEVVLLGGGGAWGVMRGGEAGSLQAWAASGALLGFSVMGGFSVGLFYFPAVALLGSASLWRDRHDWGRVPLHAGLALLAAVAQAALMLAVIRIFYPSPVA